MWGSCYITSGTQLGQWYKEGHTEIRHCITSLKMELTTKILEQNSNRHTRIELWAKSIQIWGTSDAFYPGLHQENPRSIYARVPARAYGLRPDYMAPVLNKMLVTV